MMKKNKVTKGEVTKSPILDLGRAMGIHDFYIHAIAQSEKRDVGEFKVTSEELKRLYKKYYGR